MCRAAVGPYSQAVRVGEQIFVSGQIPADAAGNLVEGSIADKTTACCEGMKNILEDAGSAITKTIKVRDSFFLSSLLSLIRSCVLVVLEICLTPLSARHHGSKRTVLTSARSPSS